MEFLDAFKALEKLCGGIYGTYNGVTAYIDDMVGKPRGSGLVSGWDEDLRQLKHYRWVRNQIVHEPDRRESDMCEPADAVWLDEFRRRILTQRDPLSCYARMTVPRPAVKAVPTAGPSVQEPSSILSLKPVAKKEETLPEKSSETSFAEMVVWTVLITIIIALVLLLIFT